MSDREGAFGFQASDGLPEPIRRAAEQEERVERALTRAVRPFPPPEPEPPPTGIAGFVARQAEQAEAERVREERIRRLVHERPDLLVEPDALRDFARWQRAGRRRAKRRGRVRL